WRLGKTNYGTKLAISITVWHLQGYFFGGITKFLWLFSALANKVWALLGSYQGDMGVSWGSPWFQPKRLGTFPPATKEAWAFLDLTKEVWSFLGFSLDGIAKGLWLSFRLQPKKYGFSWFYQRSMVSFGHTK